LIGEGKVIAAKATDASLHGMRLTLDDDACNSTEIRHGERYAIEVHVPDSEAKFLRQGEVRHFGENSVGLAIAEPLPAALVPSLGAAVRGVTAAAPKGSNDPMTSVMLRLRSLAFSLRRR